MPGISEVFKEEKYYFQPDITIANLEKGPLNRWIGEDGDLNTTPSPTLAFVLLDVLRTKSSKRNCNY